MDFDMVRDAIHEAIGFLNDARFGPRKIATPMVSEKQERPGFVCVEITAPDFLLAQRRAARLVPAQGMER